VSGPAGNIPTGDPTVASPRASLWTVTLPGDDRALRFEVADPDGHAELMHDWMHQPHVAPWWGADRTLEQTTAHLQRQWDTGHVVPWIASYSRPGGVGDWTPFGYTELYRPAEDPLADYFPLVDTDRGWHVLVGPPDALGSGLPRLMGRAVLARLLTLSGIDRVVCEPDERNSRMLGFCRALGYEQVALLDLPDKRAALMVCTIATFDARWPGDRKAVS
jgi:RimJ/RimL family protein N-acetyltransferase